MIFKETQKFTQTWLWIIIIFSGLFTIGLMGLGIYQQIIRGHKFGTNPSSDQGLIIGFTLILLLFVSVAILFRSASLTTFIDDNGITYKFFPFHFRDQQIGWEEIERYEVVKYAPLLEFGGWGIRFNWKGKAFNVSGNKGLRIYLKSGKMILIGTQRDKELTDFLTKLK
jgi:hypothetical protein